MTTKTCIFLPGCENPEAPVSHAVKTNSLVFVSGQVGADIKTGKFDSNQSIEDETTQALENVKQILITAGSSLRDVVKVTVFITNMDYFSRVNEVYKKYFPVDRPARSCIQAGLAKDYRIEVEAIAIARE